MPLPAATSSPHRTWAEPYARSRMAAGRRKRTAIRPRTMAWLGNAGASKRRESNTRVTDDRSCFVARSGSADVDARPLERALDRAAQDLAGDGGGVALPQCQILQDVRDRVALRPSEVGVRDLARPIAH